MAVKNVALGGASDWTQGEAPSATDLNDTIDAAISKIQTLSAFWLNSDLYDVYDDFESYSVGAISSNTNWTLTDGSASNSTMSFEILSSALPSGTTSKVLHADGNYVSSGNPYGIIQMNLSTADAHKHVKGWMVVTNSNDGVEYGRLRVKIGSGSSYLSIIDQDPGGNSATMSIPFDILIVAKGSDEYDIYGSGKLIGTQTSADPNLYIDVYGNLSSIDVYIDDVVESKSTIS